MAQEADATAEAIVSARLVAAIHAGDPAAEHELIERYGRGLLYLLKRRCGDAELALDLRQDTFAVALEKLRAAPIDERGRLAAFLRGIALNLLVAHNRKLVRRSTTADSDAVDLAADGRPGPDSELERRQIAAAVRTLLDELKTPRDREVLERVYLLDQDRERICAELGIDATHFSRVLFRAKQRFRELLEAAERRGRLRLVG